MSLHPFTKKFWKLLPSVDQFFKDADFILQQDLAPAHTAKGPKSWLNANVGVLDWPANSPDLLNVSQNHHKNNQRLKLIQSVCI